MEYRIVFHAKAEAELEQLYDDIAERASPAVAWNFVAGIGDYCLGLPTFAQRGTERVEIMPGLRIIGYRRAVSIVFAVDGERVLACLTLAAQVEGREITTIEGLADQDGTLNAVQAAFLEQDAFQCGYCTPGQIMSAVACIREGHAGSDEEIREYMAGNLCRCGAYPNIVAAVRQAAQELRS
ncbi:MAG: hypothetical protein E5V53_19885 [Mesorhizobium sp.]|nr:MAG: hypothetical protein E5V53_19885 [Mesorhizobium sp.]